MAIDPNQLSQDKTFLGMQPEDQRGYLSSQDDTFAKMSPDDQNGYIQHLTGRTPLPPAPTLPGGGTLPGVAGPSPIKPESSLTDQAMGGLYNLGNNAKSFATGVAKGVGSGFTGGTDVSGGTPAQENAATANILSGKAPGPLPHTNLLAPKNEYEKKGFLGALATQAVAAAEPLAEEIPGLISAGVRKGVPGAPYLQSKISPPEADIASSIYTPEGKAIAGSLRSNSHVDMPAEATRAVPALKEALADLGSQPKDFQGMNGPATLKRGTAHAIDINEARNKASIDPARPDPADVSKSPELQELLGKKNPTVGDVDDFRMAANKKLAKSGYYSQSPSQQYAAGPDLAKLETAADQARDLVYGEVYNKTGVDLRPQKAVESALIKLNDVAHSTNNTLAQQEAKFQNAPALKRLGGSVKMLINPKSIVTNAFEPTMSSPTNEFNRNMQNVFQDVKPTPGSIMKNGRLVTPPGQTGPVNFPRYNLNLEGTPPPGPAVQNSLPLTPGEQEHGFELTPTPGAVPPEPNRQLPLSLEPGEYGFNLAPPPGQTPAAPSSQFGLPGIGPGGADLHVPPQPTLPGSTPLPRSLGAAAASPAETELPQQLREAAGLERRTAPRSKLMSSNELEDAIKRRKPVTTAFDDTDRSMDTIKGDKLMPKPPGRQNAAPQGGHAGGGVASIEEINRPGKNYVVSKQGKLTYHGKSFAPEETPAGGAHVTVLPDGKFRVNEGTLTPTMATALKNGLK